MSTWQHWIVCYQGIEAGLGTKAGSHEARVNLAVYAGWLFPMGAVPAVAMQC